MTDFFSSIVCVHFYVVLKLHSKVPKWFYTSSSGCQVHLLSMFFIRDPLSAKNCSNFPPMKTQDFFFSFQKPPIVEVKIGSLIFF